MNAGFRNAQMKFAKLRMSLDDPLLAGPDARLENIDALSDPGLGIAWRLKPETGDRRPLRPTNFVHTRPR